MERRNGDAFLQLATRLPVDAALPQAFEGVLEDVFLADGSTDGFSFGRLIAVFAYAGRVAVECVTKERGNYVWMIVVILIKLIFERLRPDMERLGGWVSSTEPLQLSVCRELAFRSEISIPRSSLPILKLIVDNFFGLSALSKYRIRFFGKKHEASSCQSRTRPKWK